MSLTRYGIFLAYAPSVDLRHEGLGRYLASFLKGATSRDDVRFVVACPSWSREGLIELCAAEGVPRDHIEILSPRPKPIVLRLFEFYSSRGRRRPVVTFLRRTWSAVRRAKDAVQYRLERRLVSAHGILGLLPVLSAVVLVGALLALFAPILLAGVALAVFLPRIQRLFRVYGGRCRRQVKRIKGILRQPKEDGFVVRLYRTMEEIETQRMLELIGQRPDVSAWYSPTAFWPAFNKIGAPRLMCIPDVVLREFPVGFCDLGGDRFLGAFEAVEAAIRGGDHFVTYSEFVKWDTAVDLYGVDPSRVEVIYHAPNDLSRFVTISGCADPEAASREYCEGLLQQALFRSYNTPYAQGFLNRSFKFIFYASQLRPNKNIFLLLDAYRNLLHSGKSGCKLIVTGRLDNLRSVGDYVRKHRLDNDVLFLSGLSVSELAACYKLAEVAVNPSLSEGGCPFTFTEALSVFTPVVMGRIAVSEEVLQDPEVREMTFFDPYDWRDAAHRIEWALNHREQLLAVQRPVYEQMARRTWSDVVEQHIAALRRVASSSCERAG